MDGNINLTSYVVKTSKGKKNIMMLSTVRLLLGITMDDDKKKPALYKLYDFNKGGTDIVDQTFGTYTVKPKCRKWSIATFSYLLDTACVNASTIVALNKEESPKKVNSFDFAYDLARSFVLPLIYRRPRNGLNMPTLGKISFITGVDECQRKKKEAVEAATNYPVLVDPPKICEKCRESSTGAQGKKRKGDLNALKTVC